MKDFSNRASLELYDWSIKHCRQIIGGRKKCNLKLCAKRMVSSDVLSVVVVCGLRKRYFVFSWDRLWQQGGLAHTPR